MLFRKENRVYSVEKFPSTKDPVWDWYKVDIDIPTDWLTYVLTNKETIHIVRVSYDYRNKKIVVMTKGEYKCEIRWRYEDAFLDKIGLSWEDLKE